MTQRVQEIVLYRVNDTAAFDVARREAEAKARHLPGWLGWQHLASTSDAAMRADLVSWRDEASAKAAGERVGKAPEFAPFREGIAGVDHFGHYRAMGGLAEAPAAGWGIELGRFRLRDGLDAAEMQRAHDTMVRGYLSQQDGWRGQFLVDLGQGAYMDVALAVTPERAEGICASWLGNPLCEAFLAFVAHPNMAFGKIAASFPG